MVPPSSLTAWDAERVHHNGFIVWLGPRVPKKQCP